MICRLGKGLERGAKAGNPERTLRAFTIFNLVDCLEKLKEQGYFYLQEWVRLGEDGDIWSGSDTERPELDDEWLEQQKRQPITAIWMIFEHFLTGEKKYLYVRKEELLYGEGTVMWISDRVGDLDDNVRTDIWIGDKPSVLKGILQETGIIPELGVFQKISVEALQEQTKGSLFSRLYSLGFRQLREGWGKVIYLHFKMAPHTYKQSKMLTMVLDENPTLRGDGSGEPEQPMLHFDKILVSCGLCLREKELHKIYDTALRGDNTDSLLTVLAKNRYVQKRVGRVNHITDGKIKSYWAGEFLDEKAEPGEACYLYLMQIRIEVKGLTGTEGSQKESYMVSPEWYLMKSKEPLGEIRLDKGIAIQLTELEWLNLPFAEYYDLPESELVVYEEQKERFTLSSENLNRVLAKLHQDGYRFRRERTYLALPELCALTEEQTKTISATIGINAEYAKCGLNRIEIEFVNQVTREPALKGKFNICPAFCLQNRTSNVFHIPVLFRCTYPHPVNVLLLPVLL